MNSVNSGRSLILADRTNIGIFGRTNAGKSTLMNLITGQGTSIVDPKPGTTADVVQTIMEVHGLGPLKLFDTAGMDERSELGMKKKFKTLQTLKECDLVLLVVDPSESSKLKDFSVDNEVVSLCRQYEKQLFIIYNVFNPNFNQLGKPSPEQLAEECQKNIFNSQNTTRIVLDLHAKEAGRQLIDFIKTNYLKKDRKLELLPFIRPYSFVAMNIPVDEETPQGRLLRPQNVVLDYLLRRMVPFAGYRMDLVKARSRIAEVREEERQNYLNFLSELNGESNGLQLVITDSQAIDVVDPWTPKEIPLTTFSVTMIHYQSNGNLKRFVDGLKVISALQEGDRIAIAEACNHNRTCEDIGTVQIPRRLKNKLGINLDIEFIFGREFPPEDKLKEYKLLVHCGGCMIDSQKVNARMDDLLNLTIPITNYGLLLSYLSGEDTLKRVLKPWGL
ncbi:MAG: GTPase [Spirochaetota bacterium]